MSSNSEITSSNPGSDGNEFATWCAQVEALCQEKFSGLGMDDVVGDMPTRDHFDAGTTPEAFVRDVVFDRVREDHPDVAEALGLDD